MRLIIEIPDFVFSLAKKTNIIRANIEGLEKAIIEGKPLPEWHGRLIDADALKAKMPIEYGHGNVYSGAIVNQYIDEAPTIIEAESEAEHGKEIQ